MPEKRPSQAMDIPFSTTMGNAERHTGIKTSGSGIGVAVRLSAPFKKVMIYDTLKHGPFG